jgi:electron transfer flavoprotein alpha/beta subunit
MDAKKKPVEVLTLGDLGVTAAVTQQVVAVADAPVRAGGSVVEDDGQAHLRIIELLEARKVI